MLDTKRVCKIGLTHMQKFCICLSSLCKLFPERFFFFIFTIFVIVVIGQLCFLCISASRFVCAVVFPFPSPFSLSPFSLSFSHFLSLATFIPFGCLQEGQSQVCSPLCRCCFSTQPPFPFTGNLDSCIRSTRLHYSQPHT